MSARSVFCGARSSRRRAACSFVNRRAGVLQSCGSLAKRPAAGAAKHDGCEAAAARATARASSRRVGLEEGLHLQQPHGQLKLPLPAQPATRVVQLLMWQRVRQHGPATECWPRVGLRTLLRNAAAQRAATAAARSACSRGRSQCQPTMWHTGESCAPASGNRERDSAQLVVARAAGTSAPSNPENTLTRAGGAKKCNRGRTRRRRPTGRRA